MKYLFKFVLLSCYFVSASAIARDQLFDNRDPQFLIKSCREVIEIFERRDKKKFLAGVATSISEAMRAGYCIGVVQQYRQSGSDCHLGNRDWFSIAELIANEPLNADKGKGVPVSVLLRKAKCDR